MKKKKNKEPVLYNKGPIVTYFILIFLVCFSITMTSCFAGYGTPLFSVGIILACVLSMVGIILVSRSRKVAPAPIISLIYICINLPQFINSFIANSFNNYGFYLSALMYVLFIISFFLFVFGHAYDNYKRVATSYFFLVLGLIFFLSMNIVTLVFYYKYSSIIATYFDLGMYIYMYIYPTTVLVLLPLFGMISPIKVARKLASEK